ncbi:MAG: hypothetical protein ACE14T_04365 [Syntrophales bacterium]
MFDSICTEKGISLIEVVVAILLTAIGVIALLSLQPQAWEMSGKTDYLGRAAGILNSELERVELSIMNPNNSVTAGTTSRTVLTSGGSSALTGDASYTVQTTIASAGTNVWRVTVVVTWPANSTGVSGSLLVTRQEPFRS